MKSKIIVFIYVILNITQSGCRKDADPYYLTRNEKLYAAFQIGTYWIYRNDSSLVEDSIYVVAVRSGFENREGDGYIVESKEYLGTTLKSALDTNIEMYYGLTAEGKNKAIFSWGSNYCCNTNIVNWHMSATIMDITTEEQLYSDNQQLIPLSEIVINGRTYNSVYNLNKPILHGNFTGLGIDGASALSMKYIGILKWDILFEDNSNVSWSLLRYNIVFQ